MQQWPALPAIFWWSPQGSSTVDPVVAAFERAMDGNDVFKRMRRIDGDFDIAIGHDLDEIARHLLEIFALGRISVERRARHIERALLRKNADIKGIDRTHAEPKLTKVPSGRRQSSTAGNVALPTPS